MINGVPKASVAGKCISDSLKDVRCVHRTGRGSSLCSIDTAAVGSIGSRLKEMFGQRTFRGLCGFFSHLFPINFRAIY